MPSNPFFEFKHFKVRQDRCAMKISTDACVFGAWVRLNGSSQKVLDIGSGTGILSLMVKQRYPNVEVHAVEADYEAMMQSHENFTLSSFDNPPKAINSLIQHYQPADLYDEIFTNPPYFQQGLKPLDVKLSKAKHALEFTLEELVLVCNQLLKPNGQWHVILPVLESEKLDEIAAAHGWFPVRHTNVSHHSGKNPKRRMITFAKSEEAIPVIPDREQLYIFNDDGKKYNDSFVSLTKDYYLAF